MKNRLFKNEERAFNALKRRKKGLRRDFRKWLRHLPMFELWEDRTAFIPDGFTFTPETDSEHPRIDIYEIEDTSRITKQKLKTILKFGHDVYDTAGITTRLWSVNRYGTGETLLWDVGDEIIWQDAETGQWRTQNGNPIDLKLPTPGRGTTGEQPPAKRALPGARNRE
jgi:hypothetical protein